ncbi:MAG TPA: winged helix-turn-helix domain-containing protein [Pseudolabrys sp.]|nr:winged helix-turn-helix domain-containing protein [Pseudolabrys sp.]
MADVLDMAAVAALVGDPARANILYALMDGRAYAAGELAYAAHVSPQTASGHLAKLAGAKLIVSSPAGRHRYFRLAGPQVAVMLESIMAVVAAAPPRLKPPRIADDLRAARMCYDHLAGRLGVSLADTLQARGFVEFGNDGGVVTGAGEMFFAEIGIDIAAARNGRRAFCRPCIDWSERRPHLAGAVGAALADHLFGLNWIGRVRDKRAVTITPKGRLGLARVFGVELAHSHEHTSRRASA